MACEAVRQNAAPRFALPPPSARWLRRALALLAVDGVLARRVPPHYRGAATRARRFVTTRQLAGATPFSNTSSPARQASDTVLKHLESRALSERHRSQTSAPGVMSRATARRGAIRRPAANCGRSSRGPLPCPIARTRGPPNLHCADPRRSISMSITRCVIQRRATGNRSIFLTRADRPARESYKGRSPDDRRQIISTSRTNLLCLCISPLTGRIARLWFW
jgi:hypothetical protein